MAFSTADFETLASEPAAALEEQRPLAAAGTDRVAGNAPVVVAGKVRPAKPGRLTARRTVHLQDIADATAQLAIMLQSGVDVASAINSLSVQCRRPALASILADVHESVVSGNTLSEALRAFEHIFGATYIATVAAGEASGKMAGVLHQLSQLQRNELRMRRTLKSLLIYPVLLASVSTAVLSVLVVFVLPRFADLFEQYDVALPVITRVLLTISSALRSQWWLWLPLAGVGASALIALRTTPAGRAAVDNLLVRGMFIRDASRTLMMGRLCRLIGLMMESGVPLLDSIRSTREATRNSVFKKMLMEMEEAIINGRSMGSVLEKSDIVPPAAIEMLATAEKAGRLGDVTRLVGVYFEEEGESKARQIVTMLEPLITVVMGLIVAVVVLSVMLPVFNLSSLAQQH